MGEALWNHLDPEEWPNNLKVTMSRVRAKLEMREAVQVVDGRYRLSPAIDVDLRHAESVVHECAGRTLDDASREKLRAILTSFASGAAVRCERFAWGQPLLARMTDLACNAGMTLASDALARERYDDSLAYASSVASIDPFNEAACETTVRALLARGELDAARREFRRYATALADELGAVPSANLAELVRASR
jgi:DNA-binding SARP family transcriptional activator